MYKKDNYFLKNVNKHIKILIRILGCQLHMLCQWLHFLFINSRNIKKIQIFNQVEKLQCIDEYMCLNSLNIFIVAFVLCLISF